MPPCVRMAHSCVVNQNETFALKSKSCININMVMLAWGKMQTVLSRYKFLHNYLSY